MKAKLFNLIAVKPLCLIRIALVAFGCTAIWWAVIGFQVYLAEGVAERIADRIIAGDPFKDEVLLSQLPTVKAIEMRPYCRPSALRSAALIRLRIAEVSTSATQNMASARAAIRSSLSCSPSDSFLWLSLYWTERHSVARLKNLEYLRMSYRLGPNEGWIAAKRSWLAFESFEHLPPDLVNAAIDEFVGLVRSGFSERAAEIFNGPAWPVRDQLLARLKNIDEGQRRAFEYFIAKKQGNI